MKTIVLLAVAITLAAAAPDGQYHQEYNYKTSSASFKNNELQHKTDDQGYYSKDGDLEGRVKPRVSSNSEHSEYVNPKARDYGNAGYYDGNSDLISHGNLLANSYGTSLGGQVSTGYQTGNLGYGGSRYSDLESEGLASSNYISGNKYSGSSFQSGSEASYESGSLRTIASRLQNDLRSELESAMRLSNDASLLETELHRNLTDRLNEILQERFGLQTIRGGQSYSLIEGGRLGTRPNYDQVELEQLQQQIERSLLETLRREQTYRSSHQQTVTTRNYEQYTTTYRPTITYRPIYPNLNVVAPQQRYPTNQYGSSQYSEFQSNRHVQLSQAPNVASITTIATNVQNSLNNELNRLLENVQRQYFSENARYSTVNTGEVLDRLKLGLLQNLTYSLDEELRRHFGTQYEKNGYMFSTGSTNQYNYNAADLESLKKQVENNLISKLTRDFERAREHWVTTQQRYESHQVSQGQSQFSDYNIGASNNQRYQYTTPRYEVDYYHATAPSIVPIISQGIKGGHQRYDLSSQSEFGSYGTSGSSSNMAQLENQLQTDLSRQLQAALSQNQAHLGRYSSSSNSRGQADFEEAYRRLSEELQRNLTQQLQSFVSGSSGYSSSYGHVNENQLAELRSQLQNSLSSQLQKGLQQSYSSSSSFSASAGSSASAGAGAYSSSSSGDYYRGTRGSENTYNMFGQYSSGGNYLSRQADGRQFRRKRSYGYRSQPLGLSSHAGVGYNSRGPYGGASAYGPSEPVGQETDDSELIQSSQFPKLNSANIGQEIDDDDTQQIEIDPGFEPFSAYGNQQQRQNTQQADHGFSSIGLGSQRQETGYQTSSRPVQGSSYNQLEAIHQRPLYSGAQQNINNVRQLEDDSDDTQQVQVDHGFSSIGLGSQSIQSGNQRGGRPVQGSDQSQLAAIHQPSRNAGEQVTGFGININENHVGQVEDDSDDTQQVQVDHGFGSIGLGSQSVETGYPRRPRPSQGSNQGQLEAIHQKPLSQVVQPTLGGTGRNSYVAPTSQDDLDDTQQIEEDGFASGQVASENSINGEQVRQPNFPAIGAIDGKLETSHSYSHHRSLTQQHQYNYQESHPRSDTLGSRPQYLNHATSRDQRGDQNDTNLQSQQVEIFDATRPLVTSPFGVGNIDDKREITTPRTFSRTNNGNNFQPGLGQTQDEVGQEIDDSDTSQHPESNEFHYQINQVFSSSPKPSLFGASFQTPSTPKSLLTLQHGTQNELTEPETVLPLANGVGVVSYRPRPHTEPHILQVKLENITPEQFDLITKIEADFSSTLDAAVENEYYSSSTQTGSKYQKYQNSLVKLERDLRRNLTDCFAGTIKSNTELSRLNQYSNLVYSKFDFRKISDVKKYIEIKLIKKLRILLKKVFKIEYPEEDGLLPSIPQTVIPFYNNNAGEPQVTPVEPFGQKPVQPEVPTYNQLKPLIQPQNTEYTGRPTGTNVQTGFLNSNGGTSTPLAIGESAIPPQLQTISANIESTLTSQIDDIIKNELPTSWFPSQVYSKTLESIRANIAKECQKLLGDRRYAYLNIQQTDVSALEKYIESHVSKTLVEKFRNSGYYEDSFNFPALARPGNTGTKPLTSPKTFLESEIDSQAQQFEFVPLSKLPKVESDSLVTSTKSSLFDEARRPLPQPTLPSTPSASAPLETNNSDGNLLVGEKDSDNLIATLRELTKKIQANSDSNTQYVQVKLENITPEQLDVINGIEKQFQQIITDAVSNEYSSTISRNDAASNYRLYETSRVKLENDLRKKLADCFVGRISEEPRSEDLNKYSNLIHRKFEFHKVADVQKYLEIKLIKRLRYELKGLYHIDASAESDSTPVHPQRLGSNEDRRVVKLENITPEQFQLIKKIEEDVRREVQDVIQRRIVVLRQSQLSQLAYQQSLHTLEQAMKDKISEILERYCEPGLPQYTEVILSGFEPSKIYDLRRYLQIRLDGNVSYDIAAYSSSSTEINAGSPTHYSSSTYSGSSVYGSVSNQEWQSGYHASSTSLNQRGVKGGRQSHPRGDVADAEYIRSQSNAAVENGPEIASDSPDVPETTTPTPGWWTRFGNKVKKIVGKS